ncbi:DUF5666 domain-containing protein [Vibrio renipiscarius]|uniref:DUF5666 domain-containing protein n=1 Tax=Vibrio renipiscarius TaxID=1461322 RepID=A0A0C2P4G5_9VIBR|nr:DUF5666 domain-containing protein [Vibrio renipiscarius]KII77495.1 hypothetical protein OJ16_11610 [Vibrio renipiscarius]KII81337.1 hypothetical protein PL18_04235 [Vibrio renipiscarius]
MKKLVLVGLLGAVLTGCGGGGGGESNDNSSGNNERLPSAAQGTIEHVAGNTITVNGHQYDVASVSYRAGDNNVALDATQLSPGMLVALSTNPTRAAGQHVQLEPTITGVVTAINHSLGTLTVNGIDLKFANISTEINVNDWVMVSSLPTATDGYKVLSVVKFENDILEQHFEIEGTISNLNTNNLSFNLGAALTVFYNENSVEGGELSNGLWVEVEGEASNSTIIATNVEIETYDNIDNDTEIEGLLTWVSNDKSAFELNYRGRFNVTSQTRFEDGNKNHLIQGTMVEVTTGANNIALEIEFDNDDNDTGDWSDNDIELIGHVSQLEIDGSFTINSKTVFINKYTEFDDGLTDFDSIDGRVVEVEAYKVNGQYIASEIELYEADLDD